MTLKPIHVLAGVVRDDRGNVLIAQRPAGKHLAGMWEFPGGKRREGEKPELALARELDEELGLSVTKSRPLIRYTHRYPDRHIDLDVRLVTDFRGQPRAREGQAFDWVRPEQLMERGLLPADRPVATALNLPATCMISGAFGSLDEFSRGIDAALKTGVGMIQIRAPGVAPGALESLVETALSLCETRRVLVTVNGNPAQLVSIARKQGIAGVHAPAAILGTMTSRPDVGLFGASCHDAHELARAESLGADYVFLSPVGPTSSHPEATPIGWQKFTSLVAPSSMPVYALGGMSMDDLNTAWHAGAQGIAAISAFWRPSVI